MRMFLSHYSSYIFGALLHWSIVFWEGVKVSFWSAMFLELDISWKLAFRAGERQSNSFLSTLNNSRLGKKKEILFLSFPFCWGKKKKKERKSRWVMRNSADFSMQANTRRAVPWSRVRKHDRRWRIFPFKPEKKQEVGWLVLNSPSWSCTLVPVFHQSWTYQPPPAFLPHPFLLNVMVPGPCGPVLWRMLFSILHSWRCQEGGTGCWCQAPWPMTCCLPSSDINRMSLGPGTVETHWGSSHTSLDSVFSKRWRPATSKFSRLEATNIANNQFM